MGNECSCVSFTHKGLIALYDDECTKCFPKDIGIFEAKSIHGYTKKNDDSVEVNSYKSDSEEEEGKEFFFFRFREPISRKAYGLKNVPCLGDTKNNEQLENDKSHYRFNNSNINDCIINVEIILKYINMHENDFSIFFNEVNSKNVEFLKQMVINYPEYIIRVDLDVIYIGEVNDNNEKSGVGVILTPDQCTYIGEFENDKISGFGLYIHFTRSTYMGYWLNGKANDYGVFAHIDGTFYNGLWSNDKQNKKGIEYVNKSYLFMGNYKDGRKNGFGCFIWENETMYIGNIKDNNFWDSGIYFFNKKIYIGNWKGNFIEGEGEVIWKDKKQFFGFHHNSIRNGLGIYKWNDGRIYFGNWLNNKQHGNGIFIFIKNIKEYEKHKKKQFFLFFKDIMEIKKQFLLNIYEESFFNVGEVKYLFQKVLENYNSQVFYYFLNVISNMNYYKIFSEYFYSLKKKKLHSFKFNYQLYENVHAYMCNFTNSYLKENSKDALDNVWGIEDLCQESLKREYSEKEIDEVKEKDKNIKQQTEQRKEETKGIYNRSDNNKLNDTYMNKKVQIEKNNEEKIYKTDKVVSFGYANSSSKSIEKKQPYNDNNNDFSDIEILIKYLNSIHLSDMKENDINILSPLFSMASNNIIIKHGEWENGKLIKWNYSTDDTQTTDTENTEEEKEKNSIEQIDDELIIKKSAEPIILCNNDAACTIKNGDRIEVQGNKVTALNSFKNSLSRLMLYKKEKHKSTGIMDIRSGKNVGMGKVKLNRFNTTKSGAFFKERNSSNDMEEKMEKNVHNKNKHEKNQNIIHKKIKEVKSENEEEYYSESDLENETDHPNEYANEHVSVNESEINDTHGSGTSSTFTIDDRNNQLTLHERALIYHVNSEYHNNKKNDNKEKEKKEIKRKKNKKKNMKQSNNNSSDNCSDESNSQYDAMSSSTISKTLRVINFEPVNKTGTKINYNQTDKKVSDENEDIPPQHVFGNIKRKILNRNKNKLKETTKKKRDASKHHNIKFVDCEPVNNLNNNNKNEESSPHSSCMNHIKSNRAGSNQWSSSDDGHYKVKNKHMNFKVRKPSWSQKINDAATLHFRKLRSRQLENMVYSKKTSSESKKNYKINIESNENIEYNNKKEKEKVKQVKIEKSFKNKKDDSNDSLNDENSGKFSLNHHRSILKTEKKNQKKGFSRVWKTKKVSYSPYFSSNSQNSIFGLSRSRDGHEGKYEGMNEIEDDSFDHKQHSKIKKKKSFFRKLLSNKDFD